MAGVPLQFGGITPSVIRELSGVHPTFVSAFKELISNAYDADASLVEIKLSPNLATISVEDNGRGMTPFEFQDEYIRLGGSTQRQAGDMTPGGRRPIGRKGIGFLAVARFCDLVEVYSHTDRVISLRETVPLPSASNAAGSIPCTFLDRPFAAGLSPFTMVSKVRYGSTILTSAQYTQEGGTIQLPAEVSRNFEGQSVTVDFSVGCRSVDMQASIDYGCLLNLSDSHDLSTLEDFCHVSVMPHGDNKNLPEACGSDRAFTRVVLHLRESVQHELQARQRPGRVRNLASASGFTRFLWHLRRSIPVSYAEPPHELRRHGLPSLAVPISPTPFTVHVLNGDQVDLELTRPLLESREANGPSEGLLFRHEVDIESNRLVATGYLLGFSQPLYPAELRGIAIRVRGVEIGAPSFLGIEVDLPVKYRPFLNQVMGEIIVSEGLDAIHAIKPGREGFYADDEDYRLLRKHLVGNEADGFAALGELLRELRRYHSLESSVARVVQEARHRRQAFLDVSQAVTALAVGSRHGRFLRRLFVRSDIVAHRLCHAREYQIEVPETIADYAVEIADLDEGDYELKPEQELVRLNSSCDMWSSSVYMLNRDFSISLRSAGPEEPISEIDLSTDTIYLNWMHPTRGKMGDKAFIESALYWRIAYEAADGNVDLMMDLAHRLLSSTG